MQITEAARENETTLKPYRLLLDKVDRIIQDIDSRFETIDANSFNLRSRFSELDTDIRHAMDTITQGNNLPNNLTLSELLKRAQILFDLFNPNEIH